MAEHVDLAEPQRLAHRLGLLDITADRPECEIVRPVGGAGAELIEGDDTIALVDETGMRLAQVIAGQARPAVQAKTVSVPVPKL